jgi:hypothetical protein
MNGVFRVATKVNYKEYSNMCYISGIIDDPSMDLFFYAGSDKYNVVVKNDLVELVKQFVGFKFPKIVSDSDYLFSWSSLWSEDGVVVNDDPERDSKRFFSILKFFVTRKKED